MKRTETITKAINFREVGRAPEMYSRCRFEVWGDPALGREFIPSSLPHRWALEEAEVEHSHRGVKYLAHYRCVDCGERVYEQGNGEPPDAPKTVWNTDGSPAVAIPPPGMLE